MSHQNELFTMNKNELNSRSNLIIPSNGNELKRRDSDDRDTGDIENKISTIKPKEFNDKVTNSIKNGIDKCKEFLKTVKYFFKL